MLQSSIESMDFLSFRISHLDIESLAEYYLCNCENYLKTRGYDIIRSSAGIHRNCSIPHIHYQVVFKKAKVPARFIQDWKYKYSKGKIPILYPTPNTNPEDYPELWNYKCEGIHQINISIIHTPKDTEPSVEEQEAFLQYALKEKYVIDKYCRNIDVQRLSIQGNTLYLDALKKQKQKEENKEKSEAFYKLLEKEITEKKFLTYEDNLRHCLELARTHDKPVHYRKVAEHVQTICYRLEIITIDEILQKFYL